MNLRVLLKIWVLLLCSLAFAQNEQTTKKEFVPICKKLTNSCSICSDGVKRSPGTQKVLEFSDYKCAAEGNSALSINKSHPIRIAEFLATIAPYARVILSFLPERVIKLKATSTPVRLRPELAEC